CLVSAWFHCHRHDGLGAFGSLGHPCVLDPARPIDLKEASVMRPNAAFMLDRYIEETIHNRIQDHTLRTEPRSTRALRVHPEVEDLVGYSRNRAGNGDVCKLHRDFSFCLVKNSSSRSMLREVQHVIKKNFLDLKLCANEKLRAPQRVHPRRFHSGAYAAS